MAAAAIRMIDFFISISLFDCLPIQRLAKDVAVGHRAVGLGEVARAVLYAEHGEVLAACVLHGAATVGTDTHNGAFADGEMLAIDLVGALTAEDDVELLMGLVGVEEAAVLTRDEGLERQLAARGTYGLAYEDLALDDVGTHRQLMLDDLVDCSYTDGLIIAAALDGFDCSHCICRFNCC